MKKEITDTEPLSRLVPIVVCHVVLVLPLFFMATSTMIQELSHGVDLVDGVGKRIYDTKAASIGIHLATAGMMFIFVNVIAGLASGGSALAQTLFPRASRNHAIRICVVSVFSGYAAAGVIALAENLFLHFVPARSPLRILMRMADLPIAAIVCAAVLLVAFKTGVIRPGIKRQKLPTTA